MSTRQTVTILTPTDRDQIARWARNVEVGTVVTFRKKSRSTEQNAKLHAMLGEVSKQVCWVGQYLDIEDWKDMFTAALRHARVVPGIDKGTYVPLGMHTSTLTIEEMSNLIELIYAFGADPEHPVIFKDPKDNTESGDPQPDTADAPPPASGTEEAGNPDPVSSPNSNSDASAAADVSDGSGDPSPSPSGSPDAPETEREILIRFARDVLPMAADTTISPSAAKAVEKEWAAQIKALSPQGIEKARAISNSMRNVANTPSKLGVVLEHYAEVLETTVEKLGG